jgi:glycosyltransferase involved in cell wall biosynthesis
VEYKDSSVVLERLNKISNQERPLILGTIGAFDVPYKGQEDVIKAIAILMKNGVVFKYRLVGRGASSRIEKASKKHDVEDLVEIVGQLPHKEIFAFFRTIDIYIQPSKMEGMPRALIEAMSTACPALGSTAGGIPELLSKDAVFKKGKITEIIRLLTEITPSFLVDMAQRNYIEAHKYRTIELEERRMSFYKDFKKFAGFKK